MKKNKLIRHSILDISYLDELYGKSGKNKYREIDGVQVKITSQRYSVFKESQTCCVCGLKATFLAIEQNHVGVDNYHINMYGINEFGEEVLFTKDHIIPKSKGGKNRLDNYQTMCVKCNLEKGNQCVKCNLEKGNQYEDKRD